MSIQYRCSWYSRVYSCDKHVITKPPASSEMGVVVTVSGVVYRSHEPEGWRWFFTRLSSIIINLIRQSWFCLYVMLSYINVYASYKIKENSRKCTGIVISKEIVQLCSKHIHREHVIKHMVDWAYALWEIPLRSTRHLQYGKLSYRYRETSETH